jgi:hypothetical protein
LENHVRLLGVLNILLGGWGGLAAITYFGMVAGPAAVAAFGPLAGYLITGLMLLLLVLTLPMIVVGFGLLRHRPWARPMGTVMAILEILSFPLGSALGIYALWVLMSPETDRLFSPRFNERVTYLGQK